MAIEDMLGKLTDEQMERARACTTGDELVALAQAEGIELTDEQLEAVSGGWDLPCHDDVPGCGSFTGE